MQRRLLFTFLVFFHLSALYPAYGHALENTSQNCQPSQCNFYQCMENKYQCESYGWSYFTEMAKPACDRYMQRIEQNKFSQKGIDWIYSVMTCLQKNIIKECEVLGTCQKSTGAGTCEQIRQISIESHLKCYLYSGVGVCKLPLKDKLAVWKTVKPYLSKSERKMAYKTIFTCLFHRY